MITLPTRTLFPAADNQMIPPPIILIQGESQGREISITMMDGDGTPLDLTAAAAVALYYTKPDGTEEQLPCTVENAAGGTVSVTFTSSSCAVAGDMRQVILRITWSDASNSRYVGPRIHVAPSPSDTAAESSNEFALLDQLIIQAQEAIGDAGEAASAANTAAGAANDAKNAANTAAGAANAAATAANTAKDAANTAAGAANAAAGAANTAAGAANTAADRANQAAEDAEAVLDGAVTSVNGRTGAVTLTAADVGAVAAGEAVTSVNGKTGAVALAAADVGALPTAGGTMTGPLNAKEVVICDGTLYPSVDYKADFDGPVKAQALANMERNIMYFRNWCLDTEYYENYLLPDPDTGRTKNGNYSILTTKETADYVVAQGTSGGWLYQKWSSGKAVCSRTISNTPTVISGANSVTVTLPFSFASTSYTVQITKAANGFLVTDVIDANGAQNSGHTAGSFIVTYKYSSGTAYPVSFNVSVAGSWK